MLRFTAKFMQTESTNTFKYLRACSKR